MKVGPVAGSLAFFLLGPLLELGVGPWVLTGFETSDDLPGAVALRVAGALLLGLALLVVLGAFVRFARPGRGTPSPLAPPRELVVTGAYRFVRNPMYSATTAGLAGEALLLRQPILLAAAAAYLATMALLTRKLEEPLLLRRFGTAFDAYRRAVPAWLPRLRPYAPEESSAVAASRSPKPPART